ncbi:ATP-binding protein [Thermodesulfobacteriota bacterium]
MKELAVISGKGGTGKTTIVASFAALAQGAVLADCDVDAADLHLILDPHVEEEADFEGGLEALIDNDICTECSECIELCRFDAIDDRFRVNPFLCEGCGVCADNCPEGAVRLERQIAGRWFVSKMRFGPMVHARLGVAQETSGKLVTYVRKRAKEIAEEQGMGLVIVDGSPGIGCPVIASLTGNDAVLVVTEPTQSGLHDLVRVLDLTRHFNIVTAVCVNKYDLNPQMADSIQVLCEDRDVVWAGTIPYDDSVTAAMIARKSVVEFDRGPSAESLGQVWMKINKILNGGL